MKKLILVATLAVIGLSTNAFAMYSQAAQNNYGQNIYNAGLYAGSTPADCPLLKHLPLDSRGTSAKEHIASVKAESWIKSFSGNALQ